MSVVRFPGPHATVHARTQHSGSNGGGGNMDDVLRRLSNVENSVSDIRAQVSGLSAAAFHFATKNDVSQLESSLIKWLVGTLLAVAVLTFTIARFVKVGG
jgi:hypothetical protein